MSTEEKPELPIGTLPVPPDFWDRPPTLKLGNDEDEWTALFQLMNVEHTVTDNQDGTRTHTYTFRQ